MTTERQRRREYALLVCDNQGRNKQLPPLSTQGLKDDWQRKIKNDKKIIPQQSLTVTRLHQDPAMQHFCFSSRRCDTTVWTRWAWSTGPAASSCWAAAASASTGRATRRKSRRCDRRTSRGICSTTRRTTIICNRLVLANTLLGQLNDARKRGEKRGWDLLVVAARDDREMERERERDWWSGTRTASCISKLVVRIKCRPFSVE